MELRGRFSDWEKIPGIAGDLHAPESISLMSAAITRIDASSYTVPTDRLEADGTLTWDKTTIVIVHAFAGGRIGLGYSYTSRAAAVLVEDMLADAVKGRDAFDIPDCWLAMRRAVRNQGVTGVAATALAAVDTALWDLKAQLLNISLADLLGKAVMTMPVYGSGGFTTYPNKDLHKQIETWRQSGITKAKIKIGEHPGEDISRVKAARSALGDGELFVDANGAYSIKEALSFAQRFETEGVTWFEEPVTSDNLEGLGLLRQNGPAGMNITAGEYIYDLFGAERMLAAKAVDVLQLDATRCQGYSGFLQVAALAQAHNIPLSSHCAPSLHLPVCLHVPNILHMEYFHDHVRVENMIFDGVPQVVNGSLSPNDKPGHGLTLKRADAQRYAA
jgi:L-alanine-DL-glutamate epimerase-like enolase superfamily enzyme